VASRHTSLLVLESEAMYKAFGLESARSAPDYTADLDAEGSSASGELALADEEAKDDSLGSSEKKRAEADLSLSARSAGSSNKPKAAAGSSGVGSALSPSLDRADRESPAFAPPPPATAAAPKRAPRPFTIEGNDAFFDPPPRRMIPMRRIWERQGEIFTDRFVPSAARADALTSAERALGLDDSRRQNLKQAYALSSAAGDLGQAARLAERWLEKEPLDPEAITALADVEARRGQRERAIRLLGSVLDVRPGDTASHKRLARLELWAGNAELSCRHRIAIAEGRSHDIALVADAVRCTRAQNLTEIADALLDTVSVGERALIDQQLLKAVPSEALLPGDLRLEASWSGGPDLDLALLDTAGHRISWLGAATRSVISARDVNSSSSEGLGLQGAAPGEYVIELTRGAGAGSAQGEVVVHVAGAMRRIPFSFDGDRKALGLLRVSMRSRLVPL